MPDVTAAESSPGGAHSADRAQVVPLLTMARARVAIELKELFRERQQVVFTFTLPLLLMVIFGSVFTGKIAPGVTFSQYFVAGMIASGIVYTSFQNLGIVVPLERDDGTLKRLRGTPMPVAVYFIGKLGQVFVTYIAQVTILIAVGALAFHLHVPSAASQWLTFAWVSVLGLVTCTAAGFAFSSLIRNARSAPAMVTPVILFLQFTSGVYFRYNQLPHWMQSISALFPLKWLCQSMRSVFLPQSMTAIEPTHSWQHGMTALVLGLWAVGCIAVTIRRFRWQPRGEG